MEQKVSVDTRVKSYKLCMLMEGRCQDTVHVRWYNVCVLLLRVNLHPQSCSVNPLVESQRQEMQCHVLLVYKMQQIKQGLLKLAVTLQRRDTDGSATIARPYQGEAIQSLSVMQSVSGWQADAESSLNFLQTAEVLEPSQVKPCKLTHPLAR